MSHRGGQWRAPIARTDGALNQACLSGAACLCAAPQIGRSIRLGALWPWRWRPLGRRCSARREQPTRSGSELVGLWARAGRIGRCRSRRGDVRRGIGSRSRYSHGNITRFAGALPLLRASFSEGPQEKRVSKRVPANPSFDWRRGWDKCAQPQNPL